MTSRLESWVTALQPLYAGVADTQWFIGAEHIHKHDNWDRIVVWPSAGVARAPSTIGKGRTFEGGARDDVIFERVVTLNLGIWAASYEQAENRLHAMYVAIERLQSQADIVLAELSETWVRAELKDVSSGGSLVVLSFAIPFEVITSDADVVLTSAAIGAGVSTAQVTNVDLTAIVETEAGDETIVNVNIDQTEEP